MQVYGYGVPEEGASFVPVRFNRAAIQPGEVAIDITHCGVCHTDVHFAGNDWGATIFPCVPGHEIIGKVTEVGDGVTQFKPGDRVGVGCMVNSCQECEACRRGDEQYCEGPKGCTLTYNGPKIPDGTNTYGGYATGIVVREAFVLRIPDALPSDGAAPILCAGITTYQPMKHFGLKKGQTLGVAGVGGLGHMAIRLGKALGARVVALTASPDKTDEIKGLGADEVLVTSDDQAMDSAAQTLDMMISTIPVKHDVDPFVALMKPNSTLILVGNMDGFDALETAPLVFNRIGIAGSLIGGIQDTQEVLDICAEHGITPEIETVSMQEIGDVMERLGNGNPRFRHVIDMQTLKGASEGQSRARDIA